jgi:pyruvate carboxylase subunit B
MPALVVRLEVEVGQDVIAGQGLVVLEAMKMENEIRAPRAGRIAAVPARVGSPVEKGEALVILE